MESLGYLLYLGAFCFFIAIILGIAKGTSQKYLIQTLEETEAEFNRICWNVFYVCLIGIFIVILLFLISFSFIPLNFSIFGTPLTLIMELISCYSLYLFVLTLVLVIRFRSNIEMKEITKPLVFSLVIQIVNHLIPIVFIAIPIYLTKRKKQRELLKILSKKE